MESRSNFWHRPKESVPALPVLRWVQRDVSLSRGSSAAVSRAAAGVVAGVGLGVGVTVTVAVALAVGVGVASVDGVSLGLGVGSGVLLVDSCELGSSSRLSEQPDSAALATRARTADSGGRTDPGR